MPPDPNRLAEKALQGDDGAWQQLYLELRPQFWKRCRYLLRDLRMEHDDREAFLRAEAWSALLKWDGGRAAVNTFLVHAVWSRVEVKWRSLQTDKRRTLDTALSPTQEWDPIDAAQDPLGELAHAAAEARIALGQTLEALNLPSHLRETAEAIFARPEGTFVEIGQDLGVSSTLVSQRVEAIRQHARRHA